MESESKDRNSECERCKTEYAREVEKEWQRQNGHCEFETREARESTHGHLYSPFVVQPFDIGFESDQVLSVRVLRHHVPVAIGHFFSTNLVAASLLSKQLFDFRQICSGTAVRSVLVDCHGTGTALGDPIEVSAATVLGSTGDGCTGAVKGV